LRETDERFQRTIIETGRALDETDARQIMVGAPTGYLLSLLGWAASASAGRTSPAADDARNGQFQVSGIIICQPVRAGQLAARPLFATPAE